MDTDHIARLRASDPATSARLEQVDPAAWAAVREGILMTDRPAPVSRVRRLGARAVLAAVVGTAALGGGVAYAVQLWGAEETTAMNPMAIECRQVFTEAEGEGSVARTLTGDPVADCATFRSAYGLDLLTDPVAFVHDGTLYVTPREQMPVGLTPLELDLAEAAVIRELAASAADAVDGGNSQCRTSDQARDWATAELERLGLSNWTIEVVDRPEGADLLSACASIEPGIAPRTVGIVPGGGQVEAAPAEWLEELRAVGEQCLDVGEAFAVAEALVAGTHHWPTTAVVDESAACARVDMEIAGSVLITVYGPTSATPTS